jgi:hypothetical protein
MNETETLSTQVACSHINARINSTVLAVCIGSSDPVFSHFQEYV